MNKLLLRQLTKHWGSPDHVPEGLRSFLEVISQTYDHYDRDRSMLERAIELSSNEMIELNDRLRQESQELEKAHQELQTLFRNIETVFFTVDIAQQRLIQISPTCEKIYGYSAEDFLNNNNLWLEVVIEEDKHIIEANYPIMYEGKAFSHEHRILTKDGSIRWVQTKITPTADPEGRIVRIDGVTVDTTLQKEAEEISRQNAIRYQLLIEKSSDGIVLVDPLDNIIYVTHSMETILGYSEQELIRMKIHELHHPEDDSRVAGIIDVVRKDPGSSIRVEYRMLHKSGEWRWISSNITNMLHERSVNALVFNYQDITERVQAQHQLVFDRRNRDALINSTSDLMWSFDAECKLITANNSFLSAIGQMTGRKFLPGDDLIAINQLPESERMKWKELYARVLSGESFTFENYVESPYSIWGELSFNPIIQNGVVIGGSCFWKDITEKKKHQSELEQYQRMLEEAQRISRFGSWELRFDDSEKIIGDSLVWSKEVFRIFGYDANGPVPDYYDRDQRTFPDDKSFVDEWGDAVLSGHSPGAIDYRIVTKTGEIKWAKVSADLICDSTTGKRIKVVGTIQDITEKKYLELERFRVTQDLVQRNKALEQFAHIVSHNLRSPLANILGLSNLLKISEKDSTVYAQCLNGLALSAERLDGIIVDLNKILNVKRGVTEEKEMVCFQTLVENISESIRMLIDKENAAISTDFNSVSQLFTIKNYIHSIFYNLISNSIKYRKRLVPPVIRISSDKTKDKCILTFSDNGIGIDLEKYGDSVFGLYKRFHENSEGKGMGMYMVKTQVESIGGKVKIKSTPGEGTDIIIELPLSVR